MNGVGATTYSVADGGRAPGLLFRAAAEMPRVEWDRTRVREQMLQLAEMPAFAEGEELVDARARLTESDVSRGLMLECERLAGLISITALARALEVGPARPRYGGS
jgi:hypothetical protein